MTKQIPAHAELIKLWADGANIQWRVPGFDVWSDCDNNLPTWSPQFNYRVKPEPKPDRTQCYHVAWPNANAGPKWHQKATLNLSLTFDGETGVLKSAEVI